MEDKIKNKIIELGLRKIDELLQLEYDMRTIRETIRIKDSAIDKQKDENEKIKKDMEKYHAKAFNLETELKIAENKNKDLESDFKLRESELVVKIQDLEKELNKTKAALMQEQASAEVGKGISQIYDELKKENEELKEKLKKIEEINCNNDKPLDSFKRRGRPAKYPK